MESLSETELHAPLRLLILVRWSDLLFSFPFRHFFSSPFLFIREKRKTMLSAFNNFSKSEAISEEQEENTGNESGNVSPKESSIAVDLAKARRLTWKCGLRLLPPLSALRFFPFIERVNIGKARIQGLEKDLCLTGNQFNIVVVAFLITFIIFEARSNLGMKRISPSIWLSSQAILLGTFTVC